MNKLTSIAFIVSCFFAAPVQAQSAAENTNALRFLSYVSAQIVGRPLTAAERASVTNSGSTAFPDIVRQWSNEPVFAQNMQIYVQNLIKVSGETQQVDHNLPGYLAKDLALKKRPYSELLTANYCVGKSGAVISCDTQAPFTSGVLTTRAFLASYQGAYNISRAAKMMTKFLCVSYPLPVNEEPKLLESELIDQFATTSGKISFGNGNNCYSCHSQFGLHTQLFVKFDGSGLYKPAATGLQNPSQTVTDGFSTNGTMTSHYRDPARAKSEATRILGKAVNDLPAGAQVITQSSRFLPCAAQNMMKHFLRLSDQDIKTIKPELFNQIANDAKALNPQPSFADILSAILTNQYVSSAFASTGAKP